MTARPTRQAINITGYISFVNILKTVRKKNRKAVSKYRMASSARVIHTKLTYFPLSQGETRVAICNQILELSPLSLCLFSLLPQNYYFSSSIFILFLFSFPLFVSRLLSSLYSNSIFLKDEGIQYNCRYSTRQRSVYVPPAF